MPGPTDILKPPKDPSILKTVCELRQQGARRRDRDIGADCLVERRSGNQVRDGESGDRKPLGKGSDKTETFSNWTRIHRRHRSSRAHAAGAVALSLFSFSPTADSVPQADPPRSRKAANQGQPAKSFKMSRAYLNAC
eukprot:6208234-Pleurochrysis_carterae.AAC.1